MSDNLCTKVSVFWDASAQPKDASRCFEAIWEFASSLGAVKDIRFYADISGAPQHLQAENAALRAELQSCGTCVIDTASGGRQGATSKMLLSDCFLNAMESSTATKGNHVAMIVITADPDLSYAISRLRLLGHRLFVVCPPQADQHLHRLSGVDPKQILPSPTAYSEIADLLSVHSPESHTVAVPQHIDSRDPETLGIQGQHHQTPSSTAGESLSPDVDNKPTVQLQDDISKYAPSTPSTFAGTSKRRDHETPEEISRTPTSLDPIEGPSYITPHSTARSDCESFHPSDSDAMDYRTESDAPWATMTPSTPSPPLQGATSERLALPAHFEVLVRFLKREEESTGVSMHKRKDIRDALLAELPTLFEDAGMIAPNDFRTSKVKLKSAFFRYMGVAASMGIIKFLNASQDVQLQEAYR